ncbi:DNA mismatch repair protein msh6, partial [Neolecta irregularis DAH-3]
SSNLHRRPFHLLRLCPKNPGHLPIISIPKIVMVIRSQKNSHLKSQDHPNDAESSQMMKTNIWKILPYKIRIQHLFHTRKHHPRNMVKPRLQADPSSPGSASTSRSRTYTPRPQKREEETTPIGKKNEQRHSWLRDIRDAEQRRPNHPDYDPRTLYIPPKAWNEFTPFEKQFWEIKSQHFNTIVFFKKGKFYELYEDDATIGHQLFDLKLTDRVNMRYINNQVGSDHRMVGFPEMNVEHWAAMFVNKGYKVAKVDQAETALGKELREKQGQKGKAKEDKIIRRELKCILTSGTLVDESLLTDEMATYCMSIKEYCPNDSSPPVFGICFVDTATGQFQVASFQDDIDRTRFETLIAQIKPTELVLEKGLLSVKTSRILKCILSVHSIWNHITPGKEFWEEDVTEHEINTGNYWSKEKSGVTSWPETLQLIKSDAIAFSAVGALIWYLRQCKLDRELVSLGNFTMYDPMQKGSSLVLDGQTLINLEIFANTFDQGSEGTLFKLLNRCVTPFGKRLFKNYVAHPLQNAKEINARLDAVEFLNGDFDFRNAFSSHFDRLPDLERLISRVHAGSCKVKDFIRTLDSFDQIYRVVDELEEISPGANSLIGKLLESLPDMRECLNHWHTAFDREKAKDEDVLIPEKGVETEFDESQDLIESIENGLHDILAEHKRTVKCSSMSFKDIGKEIYQIEVPAATHVPKDWDKLSGTQKFKRYYSPEIRSKVQELLEAREKHFNDIVPSLKSRFFVRFDKDYKQWLQAVKVIAHIDCLVSLAQSSLSIGEPSCRPTFVESDRSVLLFDELRHPCFESGISSEFIPNDIQLGGEAPNFCLLTGANAAGKSTLLRSMCIAVIMAQIGCYVPAKRAILRPVDRIMSRLGAQDNIFSAQSTFMVEMSETKKILDEATDRSLLILDELGRGTSTYDGMSIAYGVLSHLLTHVGSIGFFTTHYGNLAADFAIHPQLALKNMAVRVDEEKREVTFLYKLVDGVSKKSYGTNVAKMAGVPMSVIARAEEAAQKFDHESKASNGGNSTMNTTPLFTQSDFVWLCKLSRGAEEEQTQHPLLERLKRVALTV